MVLRAVATSGRLEGVGEVLCLTLMIGMFQLVSASATSSWLTSFSATLPNFVPTTMGRILSTPSPAPAIVLWMRAGSSSQLDLSVNEKVRMTAAAPSRHTGYT